MAFSPIVVLLISCLLVTTSAHYNIGYPPPYNTRECSAPDCRRPCPPLYKGADRRPVATWKRGSWYRINWHKNNHRGGFYKRSLVPVKLMNNKYWHRRTTFEWGCWGQGTYNCGRNKLKECGTDKRGRAYHNYMKVPEVFPDGDYVFAMVWFGGLHYKRDEALFSDYYTCSFVRIQGGPIKKSWKGVFRPGKKNGKCLSTSSYAGECGGEECKRNRARRGAPGVFRSKKVPWLHYNVMRKVAHYGTASPIGPYDWRKDKKTAERTKRVHEAEERERRNGGKKRKVYWRGKHKCGTGKVPPGPGKGSWGKKGSKKWYWKRKLWWDRNNYCNACKDC